MDLRVVNGHKLNNKSNQAIFLRSPKIVARHRAERASRRAKLDKRTTNSQKLPIGGIKIPMSDPGVFKIPMSDS